MMKDEKAREALTAIRKASAMDTVVMSAPPAAVSRFADIHQHADAALAALSRPVEEVKGEPVEWTPNKDYRNEATWPPEGHPLASLFHNARIRWPANMDSREMYERIVDWLAAPPVADSEALRERVAEAEIKAAREETIANTLVAWAIDNPNPGDPDVMVEAWRSALERAEAAEARLAQAKRVDVRKILADVEAGKRDVFLNKGEDPHGNGSDLDCPYCGGSGHKDDAETRLAQAERGPAVTEAATRTDILREWFGGERYARDYEYIDANFGARADDVVSWLASINPQSSVTEAQREAFCRELAMIQYEGGFRDRDIEPYADRLLAALQQSAAGEEGKP